MKKYAVIVAGGAGLRMGAAVPKQFLVLHGRPVLWHTISAFFAAYEDINIVLVLPAQHSVQGQLIIKDFPGAARIKISTGGETRFQSVKNGLDEINEEAVIFVHDGVRCLVTVSLIQSCYAEAVVKGNAIPAIAATDSIRLVTKAGNEMVNRNNVRIIQTPQTFLSTIIKPAFEQNYTDAFTDEASVVETYGIKINLIEGEATNIKITRPLDMMIAEKILAERFP